MTQPRRWHTGASRVSLIGDRKRGDSGTDGSQTLPWREMDSNHRSPADISGRYPPTEWARLAIAAYATHGADRIFAEVNNGGDMVGVTLRMIDPNVAFSAVRAS